MQNSKIIKRRLKKDGKWTSYKKLFTHKQMRFVFTDIAFLFNPNIDFDFCFESEKQLLDEKISPDMFLKTFEKMKLVIKTKIDWKAFALFLWYQYQTSTYWKDTRKGIKNIFTKKTYVEQNAKKRVAYQKFIDSFDKSNKNYNLMVIKILKRIT